MKACPICYARLANSDENPACTRCGAELTPLWEAIRLARCWLHKACDELAQGNWQDALNSLAQSQGFRRSDLAEQLQIFCRERFMELNSA